MNISMVNKFQLYDNTQLQFVDCFTDNINFN